MTYTIELTSDSLTVLTYVIPPALAEVWQLVLQSVLQDLKHDTDHSAKPPVSQNQSLPTTKNKIHLKL